MPSVVTDESVEFKIKLSQIQVFKKLINWFRGMYKEPLKDVNT